jgi:hypothetical protein
MRGTIASMAMTGMRVLTVSLGLVDQPPPQQLAGGEPSGRRRAAVELAHWTVGAAAGAVRSCIFRAIVAPARAATLSRSTVISSASSSAVAARTALI